jgi:multidrug efflux pump subunit AcrB
MGAIMVVGIVVEYSILLVEFARVAQAEGASPHEAAQKAVRKRLRPILMTSLTTLFSLLPMAIGLAGGEANAPLARVICGGVIAGTLATIYVIPSLYPVFKREKPSFEDQMLEEA